jgi:hypothetical protein
VPFGGELGFVDHPVTARRFAPGPAGTGRAAPSLPDSGEVAASRVDQVAP